MIVSSKRLIPFNTHDNLLCVLKLSEYYASKRELSIQVLQEELRAHDRENI